MKIGTLLLILAGIIGILLAAQFLPTLFKTISNSQSQTQQQIQAQDSTQTTDNQPQTRPENFPLELEIINPQFTQNSKDTFIVIHNISEQDIQDIAVSLTKRPLNENSPTHFIKQNLSIKKKQPASIPFTGKDTENTQIPTGIYLVNAEKILENQQLALPKELHIVPENATRTKLIQENPWPNQIEIGLTPNNQTAIIEKTIVNPNTLFLQGTKEELLCFPLPSQEQIIVDSAPSNIAQTQSKQITVQAFDPDNDNCDFEGQPHQIRIELDYSDYFAQTLPLPETKNHSIAIKISLLPESPEIKITVNLNEAGAILYKKPEQPTTEQDKFQEFIQSLAFKKGWQTIPITNNSPQEIQNAIKKTYNNTAFTHLMIIGNETEIPFLLEPNAGNFDPSPVLDSAFYGNVDNNPEIELSVGRITLTETEKLAQYFANFQERKNTEWFYAYIAGEQAETFFKEKTLTSEEKKSKFIKNQFFLTGIETEPEKGITVLDPNHENFFVAETILDNYANGCMYNGWNRNSPIHIANNIECTITGLSPDTTIQSFSNTIVFTGILGRNQFPAHLYSVLPQKTTSNPVIEPSIGVSFKDYLNAEFARHEKPVNYAVIGDPSNPVLIPEELKNSQKQARAFIDTSTIRLFFPRLDLKGLNDFFSMGKNLPFTEQEFEHIQAGRFAQANAKINQSNGIIATDAEPPNNSKNIIYTLLLDRDHLANRNDPPNHPVIIKEVNNLTPMTAYEKINEKAVLQASTIKRIALEIINPKGQEAEILDATFSQPVKTGTETINNESFTAKEFELLSNANINHPDYLAAFGTVQVTENKIVFKAENLPSNKSQANQLNPKLLHFDSFRLVSEDSQKQLPAKEIASVSDHLSFAQGKRKTLERTIESDFSALLAGFDTVSLYGVSKEFDGFDFLGTPILSAKIKNAQGSILQGPIDLQNVHGFLQYSNAQVVVGIYSRTKEDGTDEVFYKILEVKNLFPLKENPVVLLETSNASHAGLTPSVKATVKQIFEDNKELTEKFSNPEQVLLLDGAWIKDLSIVFTQNAFFLDNGITFIPFSFPANSGFNELNTNFEASQTPQHEIRATAVIEQNSPTEHTVLDDEPLQANYPESNRLDLELDLSFFKDSVGFSFGLIDLFELISKKADSVAFYGLEIGEFASPITSKNQKEIGINGGLTDGLPLETENMVSIDNVSLGAISLDSYENLSFEENRTRQAVVDFSTSSPWTKAELIIIGDSEGDKIEIKNTIQTSNGVLISNKSVEELIGVETKTGSIEFSVVVHFPSGPSIESERISLQFNGA